MKGIISNFNGSETLNFTMAVNILESGEIELFLLKDSIVTQLIARLLLVELVLEHMNLSIELLQFVEKWRLVWRYDNRLFFFRVIAVTIAHVMNMCIDSFLLLNRVLLGLYFLFSRFLIELTSHEVLVCVKIFVEIDNLVQLHLVFTSLHRIRCKYLCLLLLCAVHLHYSIVSRKLTFLLLL